MDKYDAFISFSFKDQDIVENVVNELENKYGISCWTCLEYVKSGQSYKELIPNAIKNSCVTVVFISKDSVVSTEVPKEVGIALKREKTVIPFLLDNSEYQGKLEYDLEGVNYIDATKDPFEERIKDLAKAICFASSKPFCTDNALDNQQTKSSVIASINNTVKHSASYKTAKEMQVGFAKANVGDTITFGSYEQDSEKWEHKEPIEWLVLAREKDKMLVISKYCLDVKNYFDSSVVWKNSPIRTWLNDTFINYAFSTEEIKLILNTVTNTLKKIFAYRNEKYHLLDNDKLFLLDEEEAEKYFVSDIQRVACPTKYASSQSIKIFSKAPQIVANNKQEAISVIKSIGTFEDGACGWLLRYSTKSKTKAEYVFDKNKPESEEQLSAFIEAINNMMHFVYVSPSGKINMDSRAPVDPHLYEGLGIRPAMWIDLKQ